MTLAMIAEHVCRKIGKTDAESVADCKAFARRRHEMIYDRALWKDTLDIREVDVLAGASFVTLPFQLARPLVCWNATDGMPMEVGSLYSAAIVNPGGLKESGWAVAYVEADSVGWPYDLTAGDGGASALSFMNLGDSPVEVSVYGEFQFSAAGITPTGVTMSQTLTAPSGAVPVLSQKWVAVSRLSKPQTSQPILVAQTSPIPESTWVWPADVETVEFARVRLLSPANKAFKLGVLGKKRLRQMRLDADPPMIRGVDNALLALVEADMLERSRQYSKAAAKVEEGMQLIRLAVDQEVNQSAYSACVIPSARPEEGEDSDVYP